MAGVDALDASELGEALDAAQASLGGAAEGLSGAVDSLMGAMPGLNRTERISNLAIELGGTTNKRSAAYKRARRSAERWDPSPAQRAKGRKPRRPNPQSSQRLRAAQSRQAETVKRYRRFGGEMRVQVRRYAGRKNERVEWLPRRHADPVHIRRPVMIDVIRAMTEGERDRAFSLLWNDFLDGYDVPAGDGWGESEIEILRVELQPGG